MFAEINQDSDEDRVRGVDITVVTAKTTMRSRAAQAWKRAPNQARSSTKGDLTRWQRLLSRSKSVKPKFAVRIHALQPLRTSHSVYQVRLVQICLCAEMAHRGELPVSPNHLGKHPTS